MRRWMQSVVQAKKVLEFARIIAYYKKLPVIRKEQKQ